MTSSRSCSSTPPGPPVPLAPSATRFRPRLSRSAPGPEDRAEGRPRTNIVEHSSNSQSVAEEELSLSLSGSAHEFPQDLTRLLQNLRNDLNTLESAGYSYPCPCIHHPPCNPCHKPVVISLIFVVASSAPDEQNTGAIHQLNRKLERLTEAVVSTTSSAAAPAKDSKPSNIDGRPPSASRDSDHDLCCWEPCCGGRKFSNKSNIIRHQRERSGELSKFRCSFCNACFSRSSPRNAHEARRLCGT